MEKKILSKIFHALKDFEMLMPNDHLAIGLSGGKDSWSLLYLMKKIQDRLPFSIRLSAIHIRTADYSTMIMADLCQQWEIDFHVLDKDIEKYAQESLRLNSAFCSFCARIKRGSIYEFSGRISANKIVLAHHREDLLETLFLNLFRTGQMKSMSPKYINNTGQFHIIRPMIYVPEAWLIKFAKKMDFPLLTYQCPHLIEKNGGERQQIKSLLAQLEQNNQQLKGNILSSLANVVPSHLLDRSLHDFS